MGIKEYYISAIIMNFAMCLLVILIVVGIIREFIEELKRKQKK